MIHKKKVFNLIHDLMNKAAIIKGQTSKVERGKIGDWDKVNSSVDKMVSIMRSAVEEDQLKLLQNSEVGDYVEAWIASSQVLFGVVIEVEVDLDPNDYVYNDNPKMDSIFTNALENAINAGGTKFKLKAFRTKYYTEYSLEDNGEGMSEEYLDAIGLGVSSSQGEGHGKGTGYMRLMLAQMGGVAIWENNEGAGSRFIARVPNG